MNTVKQGCIYVDGIKIGYIGGNRVSSRDREKGYRNTFFIQWVSGIKEDCSMFAYYSDIVKYIKSL